VPVTENPSLRQSGSSEQVAKLLARVRRSDRDFVQLLHQTGVIAPEPPDMQGESEARGPAKVAEQDEPVRLGHSGHFRENRERVSEVMKEGVGENQIEIGIRKTEAVRVAESAGTLGTLLNKLFQRSFAVAKEVRSSTGIGANVVSPTKKCARLARSWSSAARRAT